MASPQVALVHVEVTEGGRDSFLSKSLDNATGSRQEPGNQRFDVLQCRDDPGRFVLFEVFSTEQAAADHKTTSHYLAWREGVAELMAAPRRGLQYECLFPAATPLRPFWNTRPCGWPSEGPVDVALVNVHVKVGAEDAFKAATLQNAACSVREPGNLRFDVYQDRADSTQFVLLEVYQSEDDAARHKETPHYLHWREAVASMMAEPRQGVKYMAAGGDGPWHWTAPFVVSGKAPPEPPLAKLVPHIQLRDGNSMPSLGFGCYKVGAVPASASGGAGGAKPAPVMQVIADAIAAGYRCFDCAQFYINEDRIGEALEVSGVPRSELFIISKVWGDKIFEGRAAVREQCLRSIKDLRCGYLDMYEVHWPVPGKHIAAYKELLAMRDEGLIRSIGVSNYTVEDVLELQAEGLELPAVNQLEVNPFLYRKRTIETMQSLGIRVQAYRALCHLGKSTSLQNEAVLEVAAKHNRTAAQILGRWCVQKGFQHIPKSEKRPRMDENATIFDFALDDQDLQKLDCLTTAASLESFKSTYQRCVFRDTPKEGSMDGVKTDFTLD